MALESDVELAVIAWAEDHRWVVRKLAYIGRVGAPDRLFVGYGQVIFMELKAPGKKPSPSQVIEHRAFADAGVKVHVVDDKDDGIALLRVAMDRSRG